MEGVNYKCEMLWMVYGDGGGAMIVGARDHDTFNRDAVPSF